mmetsp:Transcript_5144/g.7119  ORF Transcript_5144/g.7119 Transcript_5144/m.7119 type:complete len:457 (+) Transcript_5144:48-1418(+)|eukprot:CAMPEP_0117750774 /NCGR_PEP_ID=MMETSP0947-20121206/10582_1 /TAXON_ID=44440 /ORGANISM="Chattonella subsalsa, Strain CCMP2191" /LENGTH=456 /DNA_ID=CAMNT_0005569033 /DNA_START=41 /DNA_END=1411 /DNA_ORIENTATION=-
MAIIHLAKGMKGPVKKALQSSVRSFSSAPVTEVSKLSNGVRVASEASGCQTATVSVWVDAGSRYEQKVTNGVNYLAGKAALMEPAVQTEIAKLGGQVAAYTSREQTVYYATVMKDQTGAAMDLLASVVKATPSGASLDCAKTGILSEFEAADIKSAESLMEDLHEAAYLDTALGFPIKGTPDTISALTTSDVTAMKEACYTAPRIVIAGAGGITQDQLATMAEKSFGSLAAAPTGSVEIPMEEAIFCGSDKRIRYDSMNVAHVALGFETGGWTSEQSVPLMLMQTLIGSWDDTSVVGPNMASKFGQDVSEDGIAKTYSSFLTQYKDTGLFGITAVAGDNKCDDLAYAMTYHLVRLCHQVTDVEVARAKTVLKANLLAQTNSSASICEDLGRQMLAYGRKISHAEMFARIDSLTTNDIKNVAKDVVNDQDHALAAIGGIHELPDYNWIRRRSYWLRY